MDELNGYAGIMQGLMNKIQLGDIENAEEVYAWFFSARTLFNTLHTR